MAITRTKIKKLGSEINRKLRNLTLLNIFLIISGLIWIDFLGLINIRGALFPLLGRVPGFQAFSSRRIEDPSLLAREEFKKQELSRKLEWEKLEGLEKKLKEKELKLKEKETALVRLEGQLKQKEGLIDRKYQDKETYQQKILKQAGYFISMKPDEAVKRLDKMDDLLVIDILREIDRQAAGQGKQSVVPYYFTLMDPARSAVIQRKMTVVEENNVEETNE